MKKIVLTGFAAAALYAAPALAADLSVPYFKAPVAPPVTWTGCYVGGNVGYGWQRNEPTDPTSTVNLGGVTATGVVGGGQVGCDYQFPGNWVIGVQGMFDGAGLSSSYALPFAYSGDLTEAESYKTDWFATLTGRLGYAIQPQTLLYLKGGAAWVQTRYTDADPSGTIYPPYVGTATATRGGWTMGGGAEYAIQPNLSVFLEYDYIGLGTRNIALTYNCGAACGFANPYIFQERQNLQMVLVGLNYRFSLIGAGP